MISIGGAISGGSKSRTDSVMTEPHGLNILTLAGVCLKGRSCTTLLYFFPDLEHVRYPLAEHSPRILKLALIAEPFLAPNQPLSSSSKVRMFSMVSV